MLCCSVGGDDDSLLQALLTTGRADLSCRDASHGDNASLLEELETALNSSGVPGAEKASERWRKADLDHFAAADSQSLAILPRDREFHVRTGRLRRRHVEPTTLERVGEGTILGARGTRVRSREAPRATRRLEDFCKAMRGSAERLAELQGQSAEAFLRSTFEDLDRWGRVRDK